jgi:hypothetical protein
MAEYHPFGYAGKEGTCLWCGRRLRYERVMATAADADNPTYRLEGQGAGQWATIEAVKPGGYRDGYFCGLRCAYQFAVMQAQLGRRLEKP